MPKLNYAKLTDSKLVDLAKMEDIEARNTLIMRHTRLIKFIIFQYRLPNKNDRDDLFQECVLEFIRAISNYNFDKKTKITTYAAQWMHARIQSFLKSNQKRQSFHLSEDISECDDNICLGYETKTDSYCRCLTEAERQLLHKLYEDKASLSDIAREKHSTTVKVFNQKEKLLKKLKQAEQRDQQTLRASTSIT